MNLIIDRPPIAAVSYRTLRSARRRRRRVLGTIDRSLSAFDLLFSTGRPARRRRREKMDARRGADVAS